MSTVDNRVVGMEFDNAKFESKIAQTMASLDKLNAQIANMGAKNGLKDISAAADKFSLAGMTSAIENVSGKFIAMSTIGITAIANLTNRAVDAGIALGKSLSLDQVISGFSEYETNMNSIQTIMTNTRKDGTTLNDVNAALDTMNAYSDQTIYNFGEMAKNIGTFTAAGIDLDTSAQSIKGIANLAAASGSNSQQAASAMYQLSQAMASGTVKLMDWNSVVNAGLGGEMFQEALFNAGKLKGTLEGVDAATTFDQWTEAGGNFRASLEDGWITADVLTTTLAGFTGDLTEAQLTAMGYTQEQAKEVMAMGEAAKAAATEVKTFSQLTGTIKESIGSGWSQTFKLLVGNFDEAKAMFTGLNNTIGGFIGRNADARNALIQQWRDMGGREKLLEGFRQGFMALGEILEPIKKAFRDIFPAKTAQDIYILTFRFRNFMESLRPAPETVQNLRQIFRGLFSALSIGWTVIKETAGFFKDLFDQLTENVDGGGILEFFGDIGTKLFQLKQALVDGGGIAEFFDKIRTALQDPAKLLDDLKAKFIEVKDKVVDFFTSLSTTGLDLGGLQILPETFGRLAERFETVRAIGERVVDIFQAAKTKIGEFWTAVQPALSDALTAIQTWFGELGSKIADSMEPGDFDAAVDTVNLGLLGGIALILRQFLKNGFQFDFGGGFFAKASEALEGVTGTLEAMQMKLKSEVLMNIAKAIALLTASVVVLSLIDSEALSRSLGAMAVGFTQLLAAFAILSKISLGPTSAAQMVLIATGLTVLAGAMVLFSIATAIFATMDLEELAKGLGSITVLLGVLAVSSKILSANSGGMVRAGVAIGIIAVSMTILAGAMKLMSMLSWEEIGKGLVGVGGSLLIIAGAMNLMPSNMAITAVGLGLVALSMVAIGAAMTVFASMDWEEIGKGIAGVGGALLVIAGAMNLMPVNLPITALGLVLVGNALGDITNAVIAMSGMDWGEIARGLTALAGTLAILALAAYAMSGALPGALAIGVMALSLGVLADVLEQLGKLSLTEIGLGLLAIAGVFAVLGLAALALSPVLPALFGLGVALGLIGIGLLAFGAGAALAATAFTLIAKAGSAGIKTLIAILDVLIDYLPEFLEAVGAGLLSLATTFLEGMPVLVEALGIVIEQLLQTIIDFTPELVETVIALLEGLLEAIRAVFPDYVQTGLEMLLALLSGIRDNIAEVTTLVVEIIVAFINTIAEQLPSIIDAGINLLGTFLQSIADRVDDVTAQALAIVVALASGISSNIGLVVSSAAQIITDFLGEIAGAAFDILTAGAEILTSLIEGIESVFSAVVSAGADAIIRFIQGLQENANLLIVEGFKTLIKFIEGVTLAIDVYSPLLTDALWDLAVAIANGFINGLASMAGRIADKIFDVITGPLGPVMDFLGVKSPSRFMMWIGEMMGLGLIEGMDAQAMYVEASAMGLGDAIMQAMWGIPDAIDQMDEFQPVITPVLDLATMQKQAEQIMPYLDMTSIAAGRVTKSNAEAFLSGAGLSTASAQSIADTINSQFGISPQGGTSEASSVSFEQNIYAPKALGTVDIYRSTKNLVALAKEELGIS